MAHHSNLAARRLSLLLTPLLPLSFGSAAAAQSEPMTRAAVVEPTTAPADAKDTALADDTRRIIDQLIAQRQDLPGVAPARRAEIEPMPSRVGIPAARVDLDPAVVGVLPGDPLPRLRREGEFVVQRSGRLVDLPQIGAWVFVFDPENAQADLRPMIVQRCQRLASMQDTLGDRGGDDAPIHFTLTGQVHTYRGVNYLLPTAIAGTRVLSPEAIRQATEQAESADPPPPAPSPDDDFAAPAAGGLPPATFGPGDADRPGDAGGARDVMDQMLDQRSQAPDRPDTAPLITGAAPQLDPRLDGVRPAPANADDRPPPAGELQREGKYLVNRAGRLTRALGLGGFSARLSTGPGSADTVGSANAGGAGAGGVVGGGGGAVLFTFEADGRDPESAERPMVMMPCKLLEYMEQTVAERGDQVVFLVSGRVHTYRGANYLLPTMVRLEPDRGNLRQ